MRPPLIVSISGMPKTGKSHLSLTFPPPVAVFEFDIGGITPLLPKFPDKEIKEFAYPLPIIDSDPPKPYAKELWKKFEADYKEVVEGGKFATVVLDTGTAIWAIIRHAVAEELGVQKLLEVRYTLPNLRMNSLFTRAKLAGINFVTTQYLRDKYVGGDNTGDLEVKGWSDTESQVDVALWTSLRSRKLDAKTTENYVVTTIRANRYELQLNGMELENTNYTEICALLGF